MPVEPASLLWQELTEEQARHLCSAVHSNDELRGLLRVAFDVPGWETKAREELPLLGRPTDDDFFSILLDYYYYAFNFCKECAMSPQAVSVFMVSSIVLVSGVEWI
jgi:hypothetical protein